VSGQKMKYEKRLSLARSGGEDKNQGDKQLGRTKSGQRARLSSTTNAQIYENHRTKILERSKLGMSQKKNENRNFSLTRLGHLFPHSFDLL
jgi:hypothetical protein